MVTPKTIHLDSGTMETIEKIAKQLQIEDIDVIRSGLKLMLLCADLKDSNGRMLIQRDKDAPLQELEIT